MVYTVSILGVFLFLFFSSLQLVLMSLYIHKSLPPPCCLFVSFPIPHTPPLLSPQKLRFAWWLLVAFSYMIQQSNESIQWNLDAFKNDIIIRMSFLFNPLSFTQFTFFVLYMVLFFEVNKQHVRENEVQPNQCYADSNPGCVMKRVSAVACRIDGQAVLIVYKNHHHFSHSLVYSLCCCVDLFCLSLVILVIYQNLFISAAFYVGGCALMAVHKLGSGSRSAKREKRAGPRTTFVQWQTQHGLKKKK